MNKKKAFLFITFTNGQNFFVKQIIKQYKYTNYFIVTSTDAQEFSCFENSRVLVLDKIKSINTINFFRKKEIDNFLLSVDNHSSEMEIFIAHFLNTITNHIYNRYKNNENVVFSNFPDGMLTFNEYKVQYLNLENLKKMAFACIVGLDYKVFSGSINNPFNNIVNIYSHFPKLTSFNNGQTLKAIKFEQYHITGENSIILGHANQTKEVLLNNNFYENLNNKVYYKPHPRINLNNDLFYLNLSKEIEVEVINSEKPIEDMIQELNIKYVFAVASSALVNLKLLFENIECFSFSLSSYVEEEYIDIYFRVFDQLDIKILSS